MHAMYLLLISAVNVFMIFSFWINMATIPDTPAVCKAPTSYTNGTTGTCNGSPLPYMSSLPSSAIKIHSFDWGQGNRYSKWLRFRIELDSHIWYSNICKFYSQGLNCLNSALDGPRDVKESWPEPECDRIELDIQNFLDCVTEAWKPIKATMVERVKFINMNRSQSQAGNDYMSHL